MFAAAAVGSVAGFSFHSSSDGSAFNPSINPSAFCCCCCYSLKQSSAISSLKRLACTSRLAVSGGSSSSSTGSNANIEGLEQEVDEDQQAADAAVRLTRRSADWKLAGAYKDSGDIYEGRIEGFNGGGLLVRFHSLVGFLPYPLLCPDHSYKEPRRNIQEIAKDLIGSFISVKAIQVSEEKRKLIFSEKDAIWSRFSGQVNIGDVFEARVGSVEDYGAFVHLRFPDGCYYLTGLVHVSEVSWDLVQDVRDILNEGDDVQVKVIQVDREKVRITLSIKQLEDDPLLETLDKVIPQVESDNSSMPDNLSTESLPGLESICEELLQENGITGVRIGRKGFEKRVVSQDLELWLSNAPVEDKQFTLLARAGREVQEVHLTTDLDQDGIKKAVQRVLARIP
ncbi:uncharacterized protein LOC131239694 isoform X2 [Magnolia sinica]|uniref:uncharacterized protein LOC131239694 isoform X2 n=1 Tax=Magnolia sinica TaxID=86752 RepID=UPI002659F84B|nr:uncharacterized protein LOC131239694 isoform X2 [Magnolia sinica]